MDTVGLDFIFDVLKMTAFVAAVALVWGFWEDVSRPFRWAYHRYFIHEPRHVLSTEASQDDDELSESQHVDSTLRHTLQPVATPNNNNNAALHVAERAKLEALAVLIVESRRKGFQNGQVPETRGLETVFNVGRSSAAGSDYQRLRAALKAELDRLQPKPAAPAFPALTQDQQLLRAELGLDSD